MSRLEGLLHNPSVLPEGGLFCFGLRHSYTVPSGNPLEFEPGGLSAELKGMDLQLFRVLHNLGLRPEIQLSYDAVGEEGAPHCPTRGLTIRPVELLRISGSSERTLDDLLRDEGTLAKEGLEVKQVVWITPVTECTHIRQVYASNDDKGVEVNHVRAKLYIAARVKSYGDRVRPLGKRKWEMSPDGSDEGSTRPCPATRKRRRVHFKEEVEEIIIEFIEPYE